MPDDMHKDALKPEKRADVQKPDAKKPDEPKPLPRWPFLLAGVAVLGFIGVVLYLVYAPRPDVWTDDAYISVHYTSIAPRVSGQVAAVHVTDNQPVKAGQVLVSLDPSDYRTAVAMADGGLTRDTAQVGNAAANVSRQPSLVREQEAAVASAQAKIVLSQLDQRRYGNLAATGAGTTQQRQQADTTLRQDQASLAGAQAALDAARQQTAVLSSVQSASEGTVKVDQAQLDQARLNLSYTSITAPLDGTVGQLTVHVGDVTSPGATMMVVVPLDQVYIQANYREVDLRHVRTGQRVTIHVDSYNINVDGIVDSLPPATGATFAGIPPNNATGNFTKIVQRLPVKIRVAPDQPLARLLRVGFSVEATIHTGLEDVATEQERTPGRIGAP